MNLANFRFLGRSGLIVSPLAPGTMSFGTPRRGSSADASRTIFEACTTARVSFIDTADSYPGSTSEELVGRFVADGSRRDELVLATRFGFNAQKGNPNAGRGGAA